MTPQAKWAPQGQHFSAGMETNVNSTNHTHTDVENTQKNKAFGVRYLNSAPLASVGIMTKMGRWWDAPLGDIPGTLGTIANGPTPQPQAPQSFPTPDGKQEEIPQHTNENRVQKPRNVNRQEARKIQRSLSASDFGKAPDLQHWRGFEDVVDRNLDALESRPLEPGKNGKVSSEALDLAKGTKVLRFML